MTTKYIEIDRAIETALLLLEEGEDEQTLAYNAALVAFIKNMENVPAADVVEVVRCKDCKHSEEFIYPEGLETMVCWENNADREVNRNGFCDKGERRASDE